MVWKSPQKQVGQSQDQSDISESTSEHPMQLHAVAGDAHLGKFPRLISFNHNLGIHGIEMCHDIPHVWVEGVGKKSLTNAVQMIDVFLD